MADINFNGQKVQKTGISKTDFIEKLKSAGIEEAKAKSIFNQFNKNNEGDSKDVLDTAEQLEFMSYLKTTANDDTTITENEFKNAQVNKSNIDSMDTLSKTFNAFKEIVATDTSDDLEVEYNGNIAKTKESIPTSSKKRVKYDPVHLTDAWRDSREIANNIDSDKYKAIKGAKTASEALDLILEAQGIKDVSEKDKEALLKRLIKFNPSMFNRETGEVWEDADWTKLDFPKGTDVKAMISEETDLTGIGTKKTDGAEDSDEIGEPTTQDLEAMQSADKLGDEIYKILDDEHKDTSVGHVKEKVSSKVNKDNVIEVLEQFKLDHSKTILSTMTDEEISKTGRQSVYDTAKDIISKLKERANTIKSKVRSTEKKANIDNLIDTAEKALYSKKMTDWLNGTGDKTLISTELDPKIDAILVALKDADPTIKKKMDAYNK